VSAHFAEVYGASVSKDTRSRITDRVVKEMEQWLARPLEKVYAAVFIDAIYVKIRDGQVGNQPVYAAIGVDLDATRTSSDCGPATVAERARSSGYLVPGPQGHRPDTMGHALEAGTERVRHHLRRPHAQSREPITRWRPPLTPFLGQTLRGPRLRRAARRAAV
jgi:hypothetical protein